MSKAPINLKTITSQELEQVIASILQELVVATSKADELLETTRIPNIVLPSLMQAARGLHRSAELLRASQTLLEVGR